MGIVGNGRWGQLVWCKTVEVSVWVWCEAAEGSMGMVWNGRGVNGYGVKRSRGQWVRCETVEGSMWVRCEKVEGAMDVV